MSNKHRDVDFLRLDSERLIVVACDSCGAIGLKENDVVKVPCHITGKYTARVCIMEVLSTGANIEGITVNICNELSPTGDEIIKGVMSELGEIGLDVPITISTEKNMPTSMTAIGMTAIGSIKEEDLLIHRVKKGDCVYALGIPSVGEEVIENEGHVANSKLILKLLQLKNIREIIPVGSTGIRGELESLSRSEKLDIEYEKNLSVDIEKSAGPCTVAIVISGGCMDCELGCPVNLIGTIV